MTAVVWVDRQNMVILLESPGCTVLLVRNDPKNPADLHNVR